MRPLPTNYQVLTWLCICPVDTDNQWKKPLCSLISVIYVFTNISGLLSSGVFFLDHHCDDPKFAFSSAYQFTAFLGMTYRSIIAFLMRNDITAFLGKLAKIYDECKHSMDLLRILIQLTFIAEKENKYA